MSLRSKLFPVAVCAATLALSSATQAQDPKQIVQEAVNTELAAARTDHTHWRYLKQESAGNEFVVVETENGAISRHVTENGHPASPATLKTDNDTIQRFIHDPALQAKQRRDGAHDDKSAAELLNLMPEAFLWKIDNETSEVVNLSYHPNPGFSPPDMEARVMGGMSGTLVVSKEGHRIRTFKGRLENDVTLGYGLFARLKQGSTFDIERRIIAPGIWQITETHVHIQGHALFFKTISTQQDEVKSNFTPVAPGTTLQQAVAILDEPAK
ncbi:MAG: hypothetical protein M3O02_03945 [Acidobacteriota bacterium]|nr:hypothetical protein [Acidobacteriota bacterium]